MLIMWNINLIYFIIFCTQPNNLKWLNLLPYDRTICAIGSVLRLDVWSIHHLFPESSYRTRDIGISSSRATKWGRGPTTSTTRPRNFRPTRYIGSRQFASLIQYMNWITCNKYGLQVWIVTCVSACHKRMFQGVGRSALLQFHLSCFIFVIKVYLNWRSYVTAYNSRTMGSCSPSISHFAISFPHIFGAISREN